MTLVNIWTGGFTHRIARVVATIEHHHIQLPPIGDLAGTIVRPSEIIDGITIAIAGCTPEFRDKLAAAADTAVLTIEDEPAFAFVCAEVRWHCNILHIAAIPYITHLRRSALPDWYVPDERFC
ncbi:hypothetical protein [Mycobacterium avium]|uniref:hypothetical protein n=1 Tax=Mycobacterium avium TaxID=1764 RepID=UPI000CE420D9|nr:hypothetical protein [Mycobacterium avium]